METFYGAKNGVDAFGYYFLPKVNEFNEIWSNVSTLLGAGPGRFWALSAQ